MQKLNHKDVKSAYYAVAANKNAGDAGKIDMKHVKTLKTFFKYVKLYNKENSANPFPS